MNVPCDFESIEFVYSIACLKATKIGIKNVYKMAMHNATKRSLRMYQIAAVCSVIHKF